MAIVKMKRLSLVGMAPDREELLRRLQSLGCVEVEEPDGEADEEALSLLTRTDDGALAAAKAEAAALSAALRILDRYDKEKGGLLKTRPQISEGELFDEEAALEARQAAQTIDEQERRLAAIAAEEGRLRTQKEALSPWLELDVPLESSSTKDVAVVFGTLPVRTDWDALGAELGALTDLYELERAGRDRDAQYLLAVCHRSVEEPFFALLKERGFVRATLRGWTGTAKENTAVIEKKLLELSGQAEDARNVILSQREHRSAMERYQDRLSQDVQRQEVKGRLLSSQAAFFLRGWVPESEVHSLEQALSGYVCAWETADPAPEDYPEVPVKLKNNLFTRSMNVITEMYSLPAYDGVDPNPLMAPFFILFFGMMLADMGYGILMVAASLFVLLRVRPKNSAFMEMILWCGISTFIWGALSGGFFGDFIPQLLSIVDPGSTFEMPALFTPLDDIVVIMIGSLVLGFLQILTGMTVSVVKKTQEGEFLDALFGEISWWIVLLGLGLMVSGMMVAGAPAVLTTVGQGLLIVGFLMLALGGTRKAKGFGKVTSFVGILYNGVTGFFSDTLSYIRLMALMVSGSVIAQVFNTLGATFGNVVLFLIISLLGNALNLALSLLGGYVHDLRLQCLEFFGRFYKEGGKPYKPLSIQTKYVDIIKEEN